MFGVVEQPSGVGFLWGSEGPFLGKLNLVLRIGLGGGGAQ